MFVKDIRLNGENPAARGMGARGFTLIEVLVVVAILGMTAAIATMAVGKQLQRERLQNTAQQLAGFVENGFVRAQTSSGGVILRGTLKADGSCAFSLYADSDKSGTYTAGDVLLGSLSIPKDVVVQGLAAGAHPTFGSDTWPSVGSGSSKSLELYCDSMGRTLDPTLATPSQIRMPAVLSLTHAAMLDGGLGPSIRYDITVFPVWHATLAQGRY